MKPFAGIMHLNIEGVKKMRKIIFLSQVLCILLFSSAIFSQPKQVPCTVKNNSGLIITSVSITQSGGSDWTSVSGSKKAIADNGSFIFMIELDSSACSYDIRFTANDGNTYFMDNVNLCSSTNISLSKTGKVVKTD